MHADTCVYMYFIFMGVYTVHRKLYVAQFRPTTYPVGVPLLFTPLSLFLRAASHGKPWSCCRGMLSLHVVLGNSYRSTFNQAQTGTGR